MGPETDDNGSGRGLPMADREFAAAPGSETPGAPVAATRATPYAWYALGILFLVYVLNFIDRQIITILAPDLKRDLGLDDTDIGFLYGTDRKSTRLNSSH